MPRRGVHRGALFRTALFLLTVIVSASWAVPAAAANPPGESLLERQAIQTGVRLEQGRQWRDAIDHYKQAVESFPENDRLQYGLRRAKYHFSIDRRYADTSFRSELLKVSRREALSLFDDVLDKVRMYYVDGISTTWFVAHGTESLWLSLANDKFLETNRVAARPEQVQRLRDMLRDRYWNKRIGSREEAHQTVLAIATQAHSLIGLDATAVILEYVFGGCNGLDDYSNYLTPGRLRDLNSNIEGEFVGIGIVMEAEHQRGMLLVDVLPQSPAGEGGLRAGEYLVEINGRDCRTMSTDEAAGLLSGIAGTPVHLGVQPHSGGRTRRVVCTRREVHVDSVTVATILDDEQGIGYIRMTGFQKTSPEELDAALQKLHQQGMRALIWDLRGNPGGLLTAAVKVVDRFVDSGRIVSTRGRTPEQNSVYSATRIGTWHVPLVLLIDGYSASASEIVAGAIRDHRRGLIVGRTSFGKWSVQTIYPTTWATGLRLTTAKFYSPAGHTLGKVGVEPDVVVSLPDDATVVHRSAHEVDPVGDADVRAALGALRDRALTQR